MSNDLYKKYFRHSTVHCKECFASHEPSNLVGDLAMLVARLAHSLKNVNKNSSQALAALDYLKRHNLQGSPLRDAALSQPSAADKPVAGDIKPVAWMFGPLNHATISEAFARDFDPKKKPEPLIMLSSLGQFAGALDGLLKLVADDSGNDKYTVADRLQIAYWLNDIQQLKQICEGGV